MCVSVYIFQGIVYHIKIHVIALVSYQLIIIAFVVIDLKRSDLRFSLGTLVLSINTIDHNDIAGSLINVALKTKSQPLAFKC